MASLVTHDHKADVWKWFPIGKVNSDHYLPVNEGKGFRWTTLQS